MSGLVDLRYCPSSLSTLRSMFSIKDPSTNNLPPKTVADTLRCTHTCVEPSGVYFSTGSCIKPLPFEFVASRSLPLKAGFTIGWSCPQWMLSRAQHSWFAFLAKRSSRLVRHLLRPPFGITPTAALIAGACCTHCSVSNSPFSATVPQGWSYHAPRQTHKWAQTTSHDVFSPQAGT